MRGQKEAKPVRRGQVESTSGAGNVAKVVQSVDSKGALAAANTLYPAFLNLAGEYSIWAFDDVDHQADVTADPTNATYQPPTGENGSAGAWVKRIT